MGGSEEMESLLLSSSSTLFSSEVFPRVMQKPGGSLEARFVGLSRKEKGFGVSPKLKASSIYIYICLCVCVCVFKASTHKGRTNLKAVQCLRLFCCKQKGCVCYIAPFNFFSGENKEARRQRIR